MDMLPARHRRRAIALAVAAGGVFGVTAGPPLRPPGGPADLVVEFRPHTAAGRRETALADLGLEVVRAVPHLDVVRVRGSASRDTILAHPAVASVDILGHFRTATTATTVPAPNDPRLPAQWNLSLIQVPEAWSVSRGAGATVAVLDTGVAYETYGPYQQAPDLAGTRFVPGRDFVDGDDHPNDDIDPAAAERPAHGTHSAGIIAQTTDNGLGGAGVAPDAAIMPVRVLDRGGVGTDDQIAAGIVFAADHGAQVINMSFEASIDGAMTRAAVAYAAGKGVTMVAASGNSGGATLSYPAAYPEVIAVGAIRFDKSRPAYSTFGRLGDVDLVAPGGDLSVDQNGDGSPDGIVAQSMVYSTNGFGDLPVEGTSAAAPHVSGVAALLIGSGLATTPAQVRRALEASALDVGTPGPDVFSGAGLVQARAALTAAGAPPAPPKEAVAPTSPAAPAAVPGHPSPSGGEGSVLAAGVAVTVLLVVAGGFAIRRRRKA